MRGIEIGKKGIYVDTLEQYGLALMSDVQIAPPEQRTSYVEVPGMNGSLDLTETVRGWPVYNDREISFRLYKNMTDTERAAMINTLVKTYGDGIYEFRFPFETTGYHWRGRLTFGGMAAEDVGVIPVTAIVEPYRHEDFDYSISVFMTDEEQTRVFSNTGAKPVCPKIIARRSFSLQYTLKDLSTKTKTFTISSETALKIPDFWIMPGAENTIKVKYTDEEQTGSYYITFVMTRGVFE